ncbi:isoaspartyl peptidase/L-asparaginase [Homoserinibacter gongjuensis]|uniref:isoaspartyl peptidase/L-asparaginase n=1 Tax=Homoserinibacter gongjuensis TaxID=1162968 RepID=UPI0024E089AD|nr:isoaspartyl peptidase/L-asparaginase [Homoserinibacter gongjuensis]
MLLVGPGAEHVAARRGLTAPAASHGGREKAPALDTVGCVARDSEGHLAAAVSTGGIAGARVGRVGDSPLPGGGFFADDEVGAVVLSGAGEQIARVALAAWVEHRMRAGLNPAAATASALERLDRVGAKRASSPSTARGAPVGLTAAPTSLSRMSRARTTCTPSPDRPPPTSTPWRSEHDLDPRAADPSRDRSARPPQRGPAAAVRR